MDKTIELVLVAIVVIATAAIALFMVSGEASSFSDFISDQISDAEDDLENGDEGNNDRRTVGQGGNCSPQNVECEHPLVCLDGTCLNNPEQ